MPKLGAHSQRLGAGNSSPLLGPDSISFCLSLFFLALLHANCQFAEAIKVTTKNLFPTMPELFLAFLLSSPPLSQAPLTFLGSASERAALGQVLLFSTISAAAELSQQFELLVCVPPPQMIKSQMIFFSSRWIRGGG